MQSVREKTPFAHGHLKVDRPKALFREVKQQL